MTRIEYTAFRRRSWKAWSGTREELVKIAEVAERCFESRKHRALEQASQTDPEHWRNSPADGESLLQHRKEREIQRWNDSKFLAKVRHSGERAVGPVHDVLDAVDLRSVQAIKLFTYCEADHDNFELVFHWKSDFEDTIELELTSSDSGWVMETLGLISAEIDKGVPRWSDILLTWKRIPVAAISYIILFIGLTMIANKLLPFDFPRPPEKEVRFPNLHDFALLTGAVLSSIATVVLVVPPHSLLPRMEIVQPGQHSSGKALKLYLIGVAVSFIIGVLVNVIS